MNSGAFGVHPSEANDWIAAGISHENHDIIINSSNKPRNLNKLQSQHIQLPLSYTSARWRVESAEDFIAIKSFIEITKE